MSGLDNCKIFQKKYVKYFSSSISQGVNSLLVSFCMLKQYVQPSFLSQLVIKLKKLKTNLYLMFTLVSWATFKNYKTTFYVTVQKLI